MHRHEQKSIQKMEKFSKDIKVNLLPYTACMKRTIVTLIFFALFVNIYAQESDMDLANMIDSIWTEVLSLDNDTTQETIKKREVQALLLEKIGLEEGSALGQKSIHYAFRIRSKNNDNDNDNDNDKIIENFETTKIDTFYFQEIYEIYKFAIKSKFELDTIELKINNAAIRAPSTSFKISTWFDLGMLLFLRNESERAKIYFDNVINLSINEKLASSLIFKRAESFLRKINSLRIGDPFIPFQSTDYLGKDLIDKNSEAVILIDFWATWCGPCINELPSLKKIYDKYGSQPNFKMISVSLDTDQSKVERFIEENDIHWTQIIEPRSDRTSEDGKLVQLYNGYLLPTYYLIDKKGIIRYNFESREKNLI